MSFLRTNRAHTRSEQSELQISKHNLSKSKTFVKSQVEKDNHLQREKTIHLGGCRDIKQHGRSDITSPPKQLEEPPGIKFNQETVIKRTYLEKINEEDVNELEENVGESALIVKPKCSSRTNKARSHGSAKNKLDITKVDFQLKKAWSYHLKIMKNLEVVHKSLNDEEPDDGFIELQKKRQRAAEFCTRFSRIHLYQLQRQISELSLIMDPAPFKNLSFSECDHLFKKFISSYHSASQALQVYMNHVSSGHSTKVLKKLSELIQLILDLYCICKHLIDPFAEEHLEKTDFSLVCKLLLDDLGPEIIKDENEKRKMQIKIEKQKKKDFNIYEQNLSMYVSKTPNKNNWKVYSEKLAREKFGQLARQKKEYMPGTLHRTQKIWAGKNLYSIGQLPATQDYHRRTSYRRPQAARLVFNKKREFSPKEVSNKDEVETMVQKMTRKVQKPEVTPKLSVVRQKHQNPELKEVLTKALVDLDETSNLIEYKKTLKQLLNTFNGNSESENIPKEKPLQTLALPKNVGVFHVESTQEEKIEKEEKTPKEEHIDNKIEEIKPVAEDRHLGLNETHNIFQTIVSNKKKSAQVSQSGALKLKINNETLLECVKYKKKFKKFTKNKQMYSMTQKPWEMLERISDKIIDGVIHEVAETLNQDTFLAKLLSNEWIPENIS